MRDITRSIMVRGRAADAAGSVQEERERENVCPTSNVSTAIAIDRLPLWILITVVHSPIRPTCCFLIAIATFSLRPFRTKLSPSRSTRFASSSVSNVMKPYLRQTKTNNNNTVKTSLLTRLEIETGSKRRRTASQKDQAHVRSCSGCCCWSADCMHSPRFQAVVPAAS